MKAVRAVVAVLLDLVIGDDWRITAGIVLTLAVTAVLAHQGVPVWWLPPLAVLALLTGNGPGGPKESHDGAGATRAFRLTFTRTGEHPDGHAARPAQVHDIERTEQP